MRPATTAADDRSWTAWGSGDSWARVREHHDDDQIVALVSLIAMINANNRLNVIVRNPGGSYEPGMFTGLAN
ncbi:hypothetical protein ABZ815_44850 [Nonomuraea sp. NPDC047529]|uniref:hypothetical protein n=1 Tax=Nonomuraea sp. NPDC047529 TaxID=3155623 RepID=UPI0033FB1435